MKHEIRCPKCLIMISGAGYEMPSKCKSHIKLKHPKDFERFKELEQKLDEIKSEFEGFWLNLL